MHKAVLFALAFAGVVLSSGFARAAGSTEAAVRNESAAPVSVTLKDADGGTVAFDAVAPNTTSVPQELPSGGMVHVTVSSGQAKEGAVNIRRGDKNVIAVSDTREPTLDAPKKRAVDRSAGSSW
jgi:hypothetical protein